MIFLMEPFTDWLEMELQKRGWSISDLARRAGVKPASLSRILSGTRGIGPDMAVSIANALKLPPVDVFRKAKLLPPSPDESEELREAMHLFEQLPSSDQERVLLFMRALEEAQEREKRASDSPGVFTPRPSET